MPGEPDNFQQERTVLVKSYESFGSLSFGQTTIEECIQIYGTPRRRGKSRTNSQELYYHQFTARFDPDNLILQDCTLLPYAKAVIEGIKLTWDKRFLRLACVLDGAPVDIHDFIVFLNLGIAVTGIHDDDASQLAVTVFSKGQLDHLLPRSRPFSF